MMTMTLPPVIYCDDLDIGIAEHRANGYRLDMIFPADSPREALMSVPPAVAGGSTSAAKHSSSVRLILQNQSEQPPATAGGTYENALYTEWHEGRAGMQYRDLIPDRLNGKVIASHIRLANAGPVADYVHYHKVDFQMIYCLKGRIKVVYEDQGPPFWMETGDCIVQPPEIRHRVLECTGGAEVLEVSLPAEHDTWIDHDVELPNEIINTNREFNGQRFYRFQESNSAPFVGSGYLEHLTEIVDISKQRLSVSVTSFVDRDNNSRTRGWFTGSGCSDLVFVLDGDLEMTDSGELPNSFDPGKVFRKNDSFLLPRSTAFTFNWSENLKLLLVRIVD